MAAQKPSIPRGTRDFSPAEMNRRNFIFETIKAVFRKYGFLEIETPAMENLSTLMGKYGEEGDKLLFKVLNSGDFTRNIPDEPCQSFTAQELTKHIAEKGLRYDLTVPFARYVTQYRNDIAFPFKRYQVQPVWRADRPQKGRYREFYQCDADVVGSDSLYNELELIQVVDDVFKGLNIQVAIKLNNRKVLTGMAEQIGEAENFRSITVAIDKLEKTGLQSVLNELSEKGITEDKRTSLEAFLKLSEDDNREVIQKLEKMMKGSETGMKGVHELQYLVNMIPALNLYSNIEIDLTLARGLDYYTGTIIEVKSKDVAIGSIGGGGRYDNLTGVFGLPDVSGVGISFGADRIYDVMEHLDLFPEGTEGNTKILFINFGEKELKYCLPVIKQIRESGISAEMYPDPAKMKKQFSFADKKNIEFVAMAGEDEINKGVFTVKNMKTGKQEEMNKDELIGFFR